MKKLNDLKKILQNIDNKGYKAYKDIKDEYKGELYSIIVDYIQGDPFAKPSRIRVLIPTKITKFPKELFQNKSREIAFRDFITRNFNDVSKKIGKGIRGSGNSGIIEIVKCGQEILERSSVFVDSNYLEIRFLMGLPAFGRKIAGEIAIEMFFNELPKIIEKSLFYKNVNSEKIFNCVKVNEDADFLRNSLHDKNLISFIADGSLLPRLSGIDDRPLFSQDVVKFKSPKNFKVEFDLPNYGKIKGMGIRDGITLIVGGGYHGKSTLLSAVELGIYNHIPGDGREYVVTIFDAVKIRAEDGRRIERTTISPFIKNLPQGKDTDYFCSENASGSTSQAANIIESIEIGAKVLLIDEDTSATNFMIRDHRMQELISKDREPITPFIDKVKSLKDDFEISTIIVMGGSGDYFDVADSVIALKEFLPEDVTDEAKSIAQKFTTKRVVEGGIKFGKINLRVPVKKSFNPSKGNRDINIRPDGVKRIIFGEENIILDFVEQLIDISQTTAIGDALNFATKFMDAEKSLKDISEIVIKEIEQNGFDIMGNYKLGSYAKFRKYELAFAINRIRSLKMK